MKIAIYNLICAIIGVAALAVAYKRTQFGHMFRAPLQGHPVRFALLGAAISLLTIVPCTCMLLSQANDVMHILRLLLVLAGIAFALCCPVILERGNALSKLLAFTVLVAGAAMVMITSAFWPDL